MSKTTRGTTHTSRGKHKLARLLQVRRRNKKQKDPSDVAPPNNRGGLLRKTHVPYIRTSPKNMATSRHFVLR